MPRSPKRRRKSNKFRISLKGSREAAFFVAVLLYYICVKNTDMTTMQLILVLLIGLMAGIVSGALGVGGGIIIVPSLVFLLGFSQHMAQGTSLAILLLPTGILAVIQYYKNGYVDIKVALILMILFVVGAYLGSLLSTGIPDKMLKKIFGIFMLLVSIKMIFGK
jgi:uncharacterized membrane protein YfcA